MRRPAKRLHSFLHSSSCSEASSTSIKPHATYCLHGYSTQQRNHETLLELHRGHSFSLETCFEHAPRFYTLACFCV